METEREDPQECSRWWSQLPNNLQEKALAWLPLEKLCRYCGVCKEWNALFSSPEFISKHWVAAPPNKKPWLVLQRESQLLDCTAYCSFTNTWKTLSFASLRQKYDARYYWIHGSAGGLFLASVCIIYRKHPHDTYEIVYVVYNPVGGTSLQLPTIENGAIRAIKIVAGEDNYKVMAIVTSLEDYALRIEIYDSTLRSWRTAGHAPENLGGPGPEPEMAVLSEDILYWTASDENSMKSGIAGFNIQNGTSFFIPFQDENEDEDDSRRVDVLFTCGSRVFAASSIYNLNGVIKWHVGVVIIWEIERPNSHERDEIRMREIARMPQFLVEYFQRNSPRYLKFNFEGMKDMVYIRYKSALGNMLLAL